MWYPFVLHSTDDARAAGHCVPANVLFGFVETAPVQRVLLGHPLNHEFNHPLPIFAVGAAEPSCPRPTSFVSLGNSCPPGSPHLSMSAQMPCLLPPACPGQDLYTNSRREHLDLLHQFGFNDSNQRPGFQTSQNQQSLITRTADHRVANPQVSFHTAYSRSQARQDTRLRELHGYKVWEQTSSQIQSGDSSGPVCKNTATLTSVSADTEVERRSCETKHELAGQSDMSRGPSGDHDEPQSSHPAQSNSVSSCITQGNLYDPLHDTDLPFRTDSHSANKASQEEEEHETLHGLMEEDESILHHKASETLLDPYASGANSGIVMPNPALMPRCERWLPVGQSPAETTSSSLPEVDTCSISDSSEQSSAQYHSVATQTEFIAQATKHSITDLRLSDLDHLPEEIINLKLTQEELKELKEKVTRSVDPPENLVDALQGLELAYESMRNKILEGVPVGQLKPLSVDYQRITTGTCCFPAQMTRETSEHVTVGSALHVQKQDCRLGGRNGSSCAQNCQEGERNMDPKDGTAEVPSTLSAQDDRKELNPCEVWYDAEEDLQLPGPQIPTKMDEASLARTKDDGPATETQKAMKAFLCVTDLPTNVAEGNVLLWFEKYHASEVGIYTFTRNVRVAVVTVSDFQSAEAAVTEMNGCSMQGHSLHVELRNISRSHGQGQQQASSFTNGLDSLGNTLKLQVSTISTIVQQTPRLSMQKPKAVSVFPTAKGTCVPPHYATMAGLDTLVSQLTEHHPDLQRQKIVEALLELRAQHHALVSGLPLRTIGKMISQLLFGPASCTT